MKKVLLASTAIVAAAALVSPAIAADKIKLSLGGGMEQYIGFADNEDDAGVREFATFDTQQSTEVYFRGSTTLDNGIKLSVDIQLEGDAVATTVDESYLNIQTAWGSVRIGQDDAMSDNMAVEPSRGISGNHDNWIRNAGVNEALGDDTYSTGASGDNNQIHYMSPSIAGFQAGVSYTPEMVSQGGGGATPNRVTADGSSALAAGLNWGGSFSDVGIDLGYVFYTQGGDGAATVGGLHGHHAGLKVSVAGFGAGVSYGKQEGESGLGVGGSGSSDDGWQYKAGIWYSSGPMAVGFYHQHGETEQAATAAGGAATKSDETTVNSVWFDYTTSEGVKWRSMVFNTDMDSPGTADAAFTDGGWGVVGGLALSF